MVSVTERGPESEGAVNALVAVSRLLAATTEGDADDIHPKNKQDVGKRLAAWALRAVYGKKVVPSGPLPAGHEVKGNEVRVRFQFADGLTARGGDPAGFEVAGADGAWKPARVRLDGATVVVSHPDGFYSYDAKYLDEEGVSLQVPATIDEVTARRIRQLSIDTFRVLECSGLARVDFFLTVDGNVFVNEINTLPGFTAMSMYPKLWAASGIAPRELVTRLLDLAMERHAQKRALRSVCCVR